MPGGNKGTNIFLLLISVLICFGCGYLFRQSTADSSKLREGTIELFAVSEDSKTVPEEEQSDKKEPAVQATPSPEAEPTATPVLFQVSPEAASGTWTSSGSSWMFMVNGAPYTGWLTDTDGKRYFFNKDGIMQTGWVDDGGKRYFMDLDGIMQTGFITTDGKSYQLLEDGSLKGYSAEKTEENKADAQEEKTPEPTAAPEAESTKAPEPTATPEAESTKAPEPTGVQESKKEEVSEKKEKKYVALTFDDGPSSFTDRLLDCLEKNNAKATFFMVGKEIEYFSDEVKRMQELGCELGNHTYSHAELTSLSPEDMSAEIAGVDQLLLELTGQGASVVRPPYGSVNSSVKSTVGTPMVLWTVDTLDWESQDPQKIVDTVLSQIENSSIILMHDIFSTSVDAAEIFIPKLAEEGYEFVTVHELAKINGIDLQPGIAYSNLDKES